MSKKIAQTILLGILIYIFFPILFVTKAEAETITESAIETITIGGLTGDGEFNNPRSVFVDTSGNIFVIDGYNNRVQKFNSDGDFLMKFGSIGSNNGQFNTPWGISVNTSGDIFVADTNNHRIQKFNSLGIFQMKFGSEGSGDGQFKNPRGIFIDTSGNIFVADANNRIQKFDSSGIFQMKFGSTGTGNGQFNTPRGIYVDTSENIYIADTNNNRIQKFNSSGVFLMKVGDLGAGNGQLNNPFSVFLDSTDNIYVADMKNNRIQKYNSSGVFQMKFGSLGSDDGQFNSPRSVFVDEFGFIYVGDSDNHRIQKFNNSGVFQMKFGSIFTTQGEFNRPFGIFVDTSGNIFVADTANHRIQKFNSSGDFITEYGSLGAGDGQLNNPKAVFINSTGDMFISDTYNHRIQKFNSSGVYQMKFGSLGTADGQFNSPVGVFVDSSGYIYVADAYNRIQKFDSSGVFQTKFGSTGTGDGQLNGPRCIYVNSAGDIFVADTNNHRIQKFNSAGVFLMKFGSLGSDDGQFTSPSGIYTDSSDNIYVTDSNNHRIQKFNSSGVFLMKFGSQGVGHSQFNTPGAIFIDSSRSIFVANTLNNSIQKFITISTSGNLSASQASENGLGSNSEIVLHSIGNDNPIAILNADISSTLNWNLMTAQADLLKGKAFMHYPGGFNNIPGKIGIGYALYIPKHEDANAVWICPGASSLSEVVQDCSGGYIIRNGEPNLTTANFEGQDYFVVTGLTSTGGFGFSEKGVIVTLNPNISTAITTQEVIVTVFNTMNYGINERIRFTFENGNGLSLADTCNSPTIDANGVIAGGAGSAEVVGNSYEYTFSEPTQASTLAFCLNVSAYNTSGSYSVAVNDDNGAFGVALYYIQNDNEVNILANISPTLSFNIRTLDDLNDTNVCSFGTVNTQMDIPNYDVIIDNSSECGYGLAIGTNASGGFTIQIESDGPLRNLTTNIANISNTESWNAGIEAYGLTNITAAQTGRDSITGLYNQTITRVGNFNSNGTGITIPVLPTTLTTFSNGIDYHSNILNTDLTLIVHGLVVGAGTPAGSYSQVITYTATASF